MATDHDSSVSTAPRVPRDARPHRHGRVVAGGARNGGVSLQARTMRERLHPGEGARARLTRRAACQTVP